MIDVEFIVESVLSSLQAFREHEIYISVRAELQVLAQFINAPCIHNNKPSFEIFFFLDILKSIFVYWKQQSKESLLKCPLSCLYSEYCTRKVNFTCWQR